MLFCLSWTSQVISFYFPRDKGNFGARAKLNFVFGFPDTIFWQNVSSISWVLHNLPLSFQLKCFEKTFYSSIKLKLRSLIIYTWKSLEGGGSKALAFQKRNFSSYFGLPFCTILSWTSERRNCELIQEPLNETSCLEQIYQVSQFFCASLRGCQA